MEAAMGVRDGGGGGDGGSSGGSTESCVISKEEVVEQENNSSSSNNNLGVLEVSDESELELGLGLSLGSSNTNKNQKQFPGFFSCKDSPSPPSASSSSLAFRPSLLNPSSTNNLSAGTKRAASPTPVSQVVGWPPVRAYRMNSMANQPKSVATVEHNSEFNDNDRKDVIYGTDEKGNAKSKERVPTKNCLFVKVNMDGAAIGRKVNLNAHTSYESLALTLEEMFTNRAVEKSNGEELILLPKATRPSKLLDGSSEYVLTYEDKDGDWMLVGDVPWGMFLSSVKRLRIMKTSEANGLAPRSEERSAKQRSRPI